MNRLNSLIILSILLFLSVFINLKGYLERREVINLTKTILNYLLKDDISKTYIFWENAKDTPPIYGLVGYKITGYILGKKNNASYGQVYATFSFTPNNLLPSDKEWVFELTKTRYGWKLKDLHLNYEKPQTVFTEDQTHPPPPVEGIDLSTP